jgi:cupin 2 domain-containing protein
MKEVRSIFENVPEPSGEEFVETLIDHPAFRVERIVSQGHTTPEGFWYDQSGTEWVLVLSGRACVRFGDESVERELIAGDYLHIPARCRHRVEWTAPGEPTVWLAIHYNEEDVSS